ncbi:MAG: excinuclease ABC subunit UvrC [Chloroflexi bacterium]|nr:excinuclease ABC subunit UvrC [Chloroflexota bacterium]
MALHERVKSVPTVPGVYLMRDSTGGVLYVGKAGNLRNRLRVYFTRAVGLPPKIESMLTKVVDFEIITTHSEAEALILENTLIKRHRPVYNTRLRDDKGYPYIKIDLKEEFPQVYFTRRVEKDGARYFGPYASASSVRRTLELLKKLFPYRSCTKAITGMEARPCLEYYIHRCVAPCVGYVTKEEYREVISQVMLFLEGKSGAVVRGLKVKMAEASGRLEFERAAVVRDQVRAIERVMEEQKVVSVNDADMDVIGLFMEKDEAWVEVFFVRQGKLIGRDHFIMDGTRDERASDVTSHFLKQFYGGTPYVPPLVLLPYAPEEAGLLEEWLGSRRGGRVLLKVPARGVKAALIKMATENALQAREQLRAKALAGEDALEGALRELQEQLSLPRLPLRIECYDISNIQGSNAVGSMVVFQQGKPVPTHYRRFRIRSVSGVDDYAMMREVLERRFRHLAEAAEAADGSRDSWGVVPDLVLIDGGKGHLSAAWEVFLQLGIHGMIPLASIAKEEETLFAPHMAEPVFLPRNSQALFLVQRVRDEAHRFAITYHRKLRSRSSMRSGLDAVPGVGPRRKRLLLRHFGSIPAIRNASLEEIAAVPGMTRSLAQKVKENI